MDRGEAEINFAAQHFSCGPIAYSCGGGLSCLNAANDFARRRRNTGKRHGTENH